MRYSVTIAATLIGLAICLFNATGYDSHNFVFFMLSVPAWLAELLFDVHNVAILPLYILTVLTWAVLGFVVDTIISRQRVRQGAHD
ncbi:hypothetical protein DFQ01_11380 [Paenibacillus cellulosilyticus]|uniref:Uncharacterized protein n=1 Tax=Paenibacillus cellulosilyticus TaxID=375489 RepID=A0A2V2YRE1_9BACL|nr:hypothetical protein [Paenibacillus cellulosilyticus]PWV99706.1 hypothetical protein DFQ01_11380 [Paenibacillus cellulosilyticus]QKS44860.1 hypothetical protein HUB94_10895 [Paenibacillus cellulosilyticus]